MSGINTLPTTAINALSLAREVTENLDIEQQLWIIDWLQHNIWNKNMNSQKIKQLELLRKHLMSFVQPRLAWEVALLKLAQENN